jgi:hypothetical protein
MLVLYRSLLRLYPAAYLREYGGEMTLVFAQAQTDAREKTLRARVSFCWREVTGLLAGALRQRVFGPHHCGGIRRFGMRPEFRFPRSTVFLMSVILAGVVLAIDKANTVVQMKEGLPAGTVEAWYPMLWGLLCALALVVAAVAVGWGILFALRQTGMHRLGNVETWPQRH